MKRWLRSWFPGSLVCVLTRRHASRVVGMKGADGAWVSQVVCHRCQRRLKTLPPITVEQDIRQ